MLCGNGESVEEAYEEKGLLKLTAESGVCAGRYAPCCCCNAALSVVVIVGGCTARWRRTNGPIPGA